MDPHALQLWIGDRFAGIVTGPHDIGNKTHVQLNLFELNAHGDEIAVVKVFTLAQRTVQIDETEIALNGPNWRDRIEKMRFVPPYAEEIRLFSNMTCLHTTRLRWPVLSATMDEYEVIFDTENFEPFDEGEEDIEQQRTVNAMYGVTISRPQSAASLLLDSTKIISGSLTASRVISEPKLPTQDEIERFNAATERAKAAAAQTSSAIGAFSDAVAQGFHRTNAFRNMMANPSSAMTNAIGKSAHSGKPQTNIRDLVENLKKQVVR